MPIFEYAAQDKLGNDVRGVVYGSSMDQAASELARMGMQVTQLQIQAGSEYTEQAAPPRPVEHSSIPPQAPTHQRNYVATSIFGPVVGKISLPTLAFTFRQLGTLFSAGVNPVEVFESLAAQTSHPKMKRLLDEFKHHTMEGRPISFGMQRYPEVFTPLMLSIIRTGEEGGFVDQSMSQIANYLDRDIALRNLLRKVTIYPKLVLGASILIIGGASEIIKTVAPNSPISLSSPLTSWVTWLFLGPALIGLFLFIRIGLANPKVKYNWDAFVLKIPFIGRTYHQFAMAKFGRAFGALYLAGVPVTKALPLSADACGNEFLRSKIYQHARNLEEGAGIYETFKQTGAFDPIVLNMVSTGERTGELDQMLNKVSEYYEGEAETRSVQMGWVIGSVALLFVAVYVGYVYITNMSRVTSTYYNTAEQAGDENRDDSNK